jgi:mannose/cellobiose epimerase-like protein (N-acyl-D-glucosamine 2-epimerase family)
LRAEGERLLAFARNARLPGWGFGWLDSHGSPLADDTVHTYVTARMTHVFSLAALLGHSWAAEYGWPRATRPATGHWPTKVSRSLTTW